MQSINKTLIFFNFILFISISLSDMNIRVYCRNKNRLIISEKLDEYLLVDVQLNATLQLQCHFCNEVNNNEQNIWYFQDRYQKEKEQELEIGMSNNVSMNKIHLNPSFDVTIRDFDPTNAGIYKCHGAPNQDSGNNFNYRLEPVFDQSDFNNFQKGNLSDWEHYRTINLIPVDNRFAVSSMPSISHIRNMGIILEVMSEWTAWGPCEHCIGKKGIKSSTAQCRLKSSYDNRTLSDSEALKIVDFFHTSPILPCRSQLLNEKFPIISNAIKDLPEFILEQTCDNCKMKKRVKENEFKYKRRYTMAAGTHLTLICPESEQRSVVTWRKENIVLKSGYGRSFNEQDNKYHVLIDTFFTLYLTDVSSEDSGNYTCYVDGIKIMQVKIVVVSRSKLLTQALLRHMGYLGFILFITLFCYCAGIIHACMNPTKYAKKDYKMIIMEENE